MAQITIAAKKKGNLWKMALIVDNQFDDSQVLDPTQSLSEAIDTIVTSYVAAAPNATEIAVNLSITTPPQP